MLHEVIGWRGKIGLILPSVQTVTEPLYNRIAPEGVAFFASRVLVEKSVRAEHEKMEKEAFRAGKELSTAGVDCIAYCCTASGIYVGIKGDRAKFKIKRIINLAITDFIREDEWERLQFSVDFTTDVTINNRPNYLATKFIMKIK